jgi:hypothetical protein
MMAKPYEISLVSNTRQLNADLKRSADAVDGITDSLDDMAREGDRSGEKLEQSFKDAARAAKRAGDDVVREQRRMGQHSEEVGQEIRQNLGEGIANAARGDFAGLADTIGDTLGGAVAGIGGVASAGIAAAGALGLGAVVATIQTISADAEKLKETVSENFREMAENGVAAWESLQSQNQRLTQAYDEHADEINRIKDLVGLPFETVAAAWAGNADAIDQVRRAYADHAGELRTTMGVSSEAAQATIKGWEGILAPLENTISGYDQAKEKAGQLEAQISDAEQAQRDQVQRTSDARTSSLQAYADKAASIPNPVLTPTLDTGPVDRELEALKRRAARIDLTVTVNQRRGTQVI